ncbi:MAG: galactose ABC transporter substrate-binding protein [Bacilli bacterium]|jgi:methyl-galactoside transport system substrate-binding protein|nr:galactose ABC transporter substrate-binding protein [Bacilli bacterium]MCH4210708.1 galactose ABC transporter substrate-binding protein [Bacilli bacterium]MCH4228665.1 galactose ABC transporter substrate-binding protein [Bacilli bacterium]MCH4278212.1 galactose ABC transporter substrate-binding protein [Bacilli bacterium]
MKKNKALLLFGALCLASCSTSAETVQIFIYDSADPFIASLKESLFSKLEGHYSYQTYMAERKQTTQNQQIIDAIDDKSTKIMVVNTVDRLASSAIIEKAESVSPKVPVIFMNREPLESDLQPADDEWVWSNCYYVGSDPAYEGQLQAEMADELFGGASNWSTSKYNKNGDDKVQVVVIKGEQGHQDTELRSKNCVEKLRELGYNVEIVATENCNWERDLAKKAMANLYSDSIELLFSNNDEMALGAIDYLNSYANEETNSSASSSVDSSLPFDERFFPIFGVDATSDGRAAVRSGYMDGTVLNDASTQASIISGLIDHFLKGGDLPSGSDKIIKEQNYYHVIGTKITKDNLR